MRSALTEDKKNISSTQPGNDTTDKVFLLSIEEANKYFSSDRARQCRRTAYCVAQGATSNYDNCWWWLRSTGDTSDDTALVRTDGSVNYRGSFVSNKLIAVRPALWIDLKS